ncbi:MAG: bifunctional 4-hydroxy-2-oxoglutarate aldolase/2-dehydro-3-deoxy-phosphogluconate aldolase [Opitutaceae bacterium]
MDSIRADSCTTRFASARLVAVVTLDRPEDAGPLAEALVTAGITAIELTLRTPTALAALSALRRAAPAILLGAGTVLNPTQADAAEAAGADFALAPGLDPTTVRHCLATGLPVVPGVATASDIQTALGLGCSFLKWFPAEPLGGVKGLRTLAAPFRHLRVRYLPMGGITPETAVAYLGEPDVAAVGGSWFVTPDLIQRRAWAEISQQARRALSLVPLSA